VHVILGSRSQWQAGRVGQSGVCAPPQTFLRAGHDRSLEKAVSEKTLSIARTIFTLHYAAGLYRRTILYSHSFTTA
jgi:hypothetical protein